MKLSMPSKGSQLREANTEHGGEHGGTSEERHLILLEEGLREGFLEEVMQKLKPEGREVFQMKECKGLNIPGRQHIKKFGGQQKGTVMEDYEHFSMSEHLAQGMTSF